MGSTKKGINNSGFKTATRSSTRISVDDVMNLRPRNGENATFHQGDQSQFYGGSDLPCNNNLSPSTSGRFAGPSVSMDSGSMGSPSRCSDVAMFTPGSNEATGRFSQAESYDEPASPDMVGKKKRGHRAAIGGEKGGKGLRHFSMKVCEKVESKGRTTYNEVADELVAEFTNPNGLVGSPDQYDEKNIRRRVYDALNVLMAMDIISKEKKEIQWKGLPSTSFTDAEQLKFVQEEQLRVRSRIEKKKKYLQELQDQIVGIQNLIHRNERMYNGTGNFPAGGVALPFILVQTRPQATVEVEISEDMQVVHFDFNSSPFELHDDASILKAMNFCDPGSKPGGGSKHENGGFDASPMDDGSSPLPSMYHHHHHHGRSPRMMKNGLSPPPLPGILKARVKQEH
ncbi:transcription factor-like protein DPB isoform X4 [Selaginella moellendorffii]|uniref:transcription factor-like protein DPB isoform X4 n=1 Tax=Selaginella moellendorffii TaxID=88036 RepID=UPI000D1CB861|nr:transcription factor-like protein DPB isoform X4 [Selaginella moellendorffii]|eukprot:XP_024524747.1 transcription factor-like protein DPB isoform X4 [Selaginella moellendorffii]